MEIIVYGPKTAEKLAELEKLAAKVHGDAVMQAVHRLPFSAVQKLRLLDEIAAFGNTPKDTRK